MKNWIVSFFLIWQGLLGFNQVFPEGMAFQAQLFSSSGTILSDVTVGVRFNVRSTSFSGPIIWQEDHSILLNGYGHFEAKVGQGTSTGEGTSSAFSEIVWGNDVHFIELLVDEDNSGTFVTTMTQQLLSVPYAFHSKTTSQNFALSSLEDVDTSGIEIGDVLKWNGTKWVPEPDLFAASTDTSEYAYYADSSAYADTAYYALNCIYGSVSDSAGFSYYADSSNYSSLSNFSHYADSSGYSDTALVAYSAINNWSLDGNILGTDTKFLGTLDSTDLIFKSFGMERMRVLANGKIGIGTPSPLVGFHIQNNDGVLFTGEYGAGAIPIEGGGSRMMWYPGKSAFRVGYVVSTNWNDVNIGDYSFGSGYNVRPSGDYSAAFGFGTTASGEGSFAVGNASLASGYYSIAMGHNPQATGDYGVALGRGALANAEGAVAIGYHPEVYADFGLGFGNYVKVYGVNGVAMGYRAHCNHDGSFIYSDNTSAAATSTTGPNQFMVKASGGTYIYSSSDLTTGVMLAPGSGAWSTVSDRNKKDHIVELNPNEYLNKLDSIEIFQWNYITQDSSIQHIGPMAQDFYQVFQIGEDSTMISTVDIDGINMLLLKALYIRSMELQNQQLQLNTLENELEELRKERESIALILLDLEALIEEKNTTENAALHE